MNAVIVEDESLATRNLLSILKEIGGIKVLACLESIEDSVEWFMDNPHPDVVFMDIHLADGPSFEIFERVQINCPIVFATAYDEYALKAFRVNSVDYLLKPINEEAVRQAFDKLKSISSKSLPSAELQDLISSFQKKTNYKTHFLVSVKGAKLLPLQASEMAYFFIDCGMVKGRTLQNQVYTFEYTLDELSNLLHPDTFFRANRQFIIARDAITDIDFWFNNRLSVNLKVEINEKILISKARIPEFKHWFSGE